MATNQKLSTNNYLGFFFPGSPFTLNAGMKPKKSSVVEQLCLSCGLCCNGVIFADVRLQPGDDPEALRGLGVPLKPIRGKDGADGCQKFTQPCAAFNGSCTVYAQRPAHCRDFECALLKSVAKGLEPAAAQQIIRTALRRAEKVRKLLRELGDTDEKLSLSKRFRRVKRRMETQRPDDETADRYGELTMAVHELNYLLSDAFYPGNGE